MEDILNTMRDTTLVEGNAEAKVKLLPLSTQLGWLNPSPKGHPFSACSCSAGGNSTAPSSTNCCPVQHIVPSAITKIPVLLRVQHPIMPSHLEESRNGAVIFGQGVGKLFMRLWSDIRVNQMTTVIPMEVLAQPNDSSSGRSNQEAINTPPIGGGSGSSVPGAKADRTAPSPTADPLHPNPSQLLSNGGVMSQGLSLPQSLVVEISEGNKDGVRN